jgi:hypothetical protein
MIFYLGEWNKVERLEKKKIFLVFQGYFPVVVWFRKNFGGDQEHQ